MTNRRRCHPGSQEVPGCRRVHSGCLKRMLLAMIKGYKSASWVFVEKNVASNLPALRTIVLEMVHSATAVTGRCSSFSATSLLW